ncbi:MAG: type II toxin-antitoxin system PemK/MazF family toxin [Rhodospirillales bacterium]
MPIDFHPHPGQVLICDYNTGFIIPEMVKRRPVVVISPRLRRRNNLCTVVPLSTTPPDPVERYHLEVSLHPPLPVPWQSEVMWVKADMVATVAFKRLELIRGPKEFQGKRKYVTVRLDDEHLRRTRTCVLRAIGAVTRQRGSKTLDMGRTALLRIGL